MRGLSGVEGPASPAAGVGGGGGSSSSSEKRLAGGEGGGSPGLPDEVDGRGGKGTTLKEGVGVGSSRAGDGEDVTGAGLAPL